MQKSLRYKSKKMSRARPGRERNFWGWRILTVLGLLIFIVGLVLGNIELAQRREKLEQNLSDLKGQLKETPKSNQVDNSIDNFPAYLERVAREELNLRKAGESVVAFPEKIEEDVDKTEGLLQKIKDKLK